MDIVERAEHLSLQYVGNQHALGNEWGPGEHFASDGKDRVTIVGSDVAYKAVRHTKGAQCRNEWEIYTTLEELRPYLCKPLYISRNQRVIVMERLTPCDYDHNEEIEEIQNMMREVVNDKVFEAVLSDALYNYFNWGTTQNGNIVQMDYGNFFMNSKDRLEIREDLGVI